MGFTDRCDLFAAFHEDGFNRILGHVMQQRPSLFNYATAQVLSNLELLCEVIKPHPIVPKRSNPLVTLIDPLPVPGTNYGINFAVQLTEVRLDFHPGDEFALPPELTPPLGAQRFALRLKLCAGIGCPPEDLIDKLVPPPPDPNKESKDRQRDNDSRGAETPKVPLTPLPTRKLTCFCLEAYLVGRMVITQYFGKPFLEMKLVRFEIVDIKPTELENGIECYVGTMLRLAVLPKLRILLEQTVFDIKKSLDNLKKSIFVTITPTPAPGTVPNNPAVEDDQMKLFLNVEVH